MKLIGVQPKHIAVTIEFMEEDLRKIERFLSNSEISCGPELAAEAKFIEEELLPNIRTVLKGIEQGIR